MFLARVTGNVVASQKEKSLNGQKLLVVARQAQAVLTET